MFGEDKATHTDSMQTLGTGLHYGQIHTHTHKHSSSLLPLTQFQIFSLSKDYFISLFYHHDCVYSFVMKSPTSYITVSYPHHIC